METVMGQSKDAEARFQLWARAIADGEAIDWERLRQEHPEDRIVIDNLVAVDKVSSVYQELHKTPPTNVPRPNRADSEPMPAQWRHLQIREVIGTGSYGIVYRAYDPDLDIEVALKLLRIEQQCPQGLERFLDEARRLARVRHPNVITIHGVDQHEGRVGLWTDLVPGRTLEALLMERVFTAEEAALVGRDLCAALAAIHATGLVHGDVKTTNVMRRNSDGQIVLMDFGSMRQVTKEQAQSAHLYGTPVTMAPELILDAKPASVASDIYSLGVLLYRLVTQRYPIEANDVPTLATKLRQRDSVHLLDRNPHLPRAFVHVVERALHPRPRKRFRSAGEMQAALAEAQEAGPARDRQRPRPTRYTRAVAAALLVLAAATTVLVLGFRGGDVSVQVTVARLAAGREEPIAPCSALDAGDQLLMRLKSNREVFVYVLTQTEAEPKITTLFPSGGDLENPLAGRTEFVLPGTFDGETRYWPVRDSARRERLLVVAAREPLPELDKRLVDERLAREHASSPAPGENLREIEIVPRVPAMNLNALAASLRRQRPPRELWVNIIEFACAKEG